MLWHQRFLHAGNTEKSRRPIGFELQARFQVAAVAEVDGSTRAEAKEMALPAEVCAEERQPIHTDSVVVGQSAVVVNNSLPGSRPPV